MQSSQQGQKQEVNSQTDFDMQRIQYEYAQKQIVDQAIHDDKIWSRFNLVIGILGVSILLLGVGSSFLGLTSIGIVGVAGGSITSAFSILVLGPSRNKNQRVEKIYDNLIEQDKFYKAIILAGTLQGEARERAIEKIIELSYRPSKDREVPELSVEPRSNEKTPQ